MKYTQQQTSICLIINNKSNVTRNHETVTPIILTTKEHSEIVKCSYLAV